MQRQASTVAFAVAVGACLLATAITLPAAPYADGAPPGFSGGFREPSCDACHFETEINARPGQLTIAGIPERFVPGERYPLTITLSRPGMRLGGFQFTARLDDGAQAGTIEPVPEERERIKIDVTGNIQYANQRTAGTALSAPDTARWTLLWAAPTVAGVVQFHAAANAADNDESVRGDYVYTAAAQSTAQ